MVVGAGFGEETLFRGYLFERLGRLFGAGVWAKVSIVLLTSVLFALAHYPEQGLPGVQQAMVVGLVFGTISRSRAGSGTDVCARCVRRDRRGIIYWDLESVVAHFVFK